MTIRTEGEPAPGSFRIKPGSRRKSCLKKRGDDSRGASSEAEAENSDARSVDTPRKTKKMLARIKKTVLRTIQEIPKHWWVSVPNSLPGYQLVTQLMIVANMCVCLPIESNLGLSHAYAPHTHMHRLILAYTYTHGAACKSNFTNL